MVRGIKLHVELIINMSKDHKQDHIIIIYTHVSTETHNIPLMGCTNVTNIRKMPMMA